MNKPSRAIGTTFSKVPEVTLGFWFIKILATTLGETGGDAVSMSLDLGYAVSSLIFILIFIVAVLAQIRARAFHPPLYWFVIIATTTIGTIGTVMIGATAAAITPSPPLAARSIFASLPAQGAKGQGCGGDHLAQGRCFLRRDR